MDLYSVKSKSISQKIIIILLEIVFLFVSYWLLFLGGDLIVSNLLGLEIGQGNLASRKIIFFFSTIVFFRMTFMMVYLLKRKIPWEEAFSVPLAFSLYFIGFAIFVLNRKASIGYFDYFAVLLFVIGSCLNTISELQRHFWKKNPDNKGKLYTKGLFKYSMHINYFGDVLWVSAYAMITHNLFSIIIPILLICLFIFWNIPALDSYLESNYKEQFRDYQKKTKKLIPLIY